MPRSLLTTLLSLLLPATLLAAAHPDEIRLWPGDAPGSEGQTSAESVRIAETGDHVVSNVHRPSITPILPSADKNTGAAILVIAGGGHREIWIDHEGYNVAQWLADRGIAAFVLKYRLANATNSPYSVNVHALGDTQRALRLIRSRAADWHLDPQRLGVIGFSAGGELAGLAATHFDSGKSDSSDAVEKQSSRPDFQALIYPGWLEHFTPLTNSPPAFLLCASDDRYDIAGGLAQFYLKLKQAHVPVELHIYSDGGHGFGLRANNTKPVATWLDRFHDWLDESSFLKP